MPQEVLWKSSKCQKEVSKNKFWFNILSSSRIGTGRVNSSWDYSFSAKAIFSERLSFLTPCVSGVKKCWFFVKFCVSTKWMIFLLFKPLKCQCCPHIETSQWICCANQLTGFYMRATLALNGLNIVLCWLT